MWSAARRAGASAARRAASASASTSSVPIRGCLLSPTPEAAPNDTARRPGRRARVPAPPRRARRPPRRRRRGGGRARRRRRRGERGEAARGARRVRVHLLRSRAAAVSPPRLRAATRRARRRASRSSRPRAGPRCTASIDPVPVSGRRRLLLFGLDDEMAMGDVAAAELFAERAGGVPAPPGDARVRRVAAVMWQLVNRLEPGRRGGNEGERSMRSEASVSDRDVRSVRSAELRRETTSAPARSTARGGGRCTSWTIASVDAYTVPRRSRVRARRGAGSGRSRATTARWRSCSRTRWGTRCVSHGAEKATLQRVVLRRRRRVVGGGGARGRRLLRRRLHRRRAGGRRERRHAGRRPAPLARHGARGGPRGRAGSWRARASTRTARRERFGKYKTARRRDETPAKRRRSTRRSTRRSRGVPQHAPAGRLSARGTRAFTHARWKEETSLKKIRDVLELPTQKRSARRSATPLARSGLPTFFLLGASKSALPPKRQLRANRGAVAAPSDRVARAVHPRRRRHDRGVAAGRDRRARAWRPPAERTFRAPSGERAARRRLAAASRGLRPGGPVRSRRARRPRLRGLDREARTIATRIAPEPRRPSQTVSLQSRVARGPCAARARWRTARLGRRRFAGRRRVGSERRGALRGADARERRRRGGGDGYRGRTGVWWTEARGAPCVGSVSRTTRQWVEPTDAS